MQRRIQLFLFKNWNCWLLGYLLLISPKKITASSLSIFIFTHNEAFSALVFYLPKYPCGGMSRRNFFSTRDNSLSASADNFLGLFKFLSPWRVWHKLFSSWVVNPIAGLSHLVSPSTFWNSFWVCNWFLLICMFCSWIVCRPILYPR